MEIITIKSNEYDALLLLWENSVRATHDFLSDEDIDFLKPIVRNQALPNLILKGIRNSEGHIIGFIGIAEQSVEALFVSPAAFGKGIGKALMTYAEVEFGTDKVDVNEQNQEALGFYKHLGYEITGRSPIDGQGRPFPVLHLEKNSSKVHKEGTL